MTEKTLCLVALFLTFFIGFCVVTTTDKIGALTTLKELFIAVVSGLIGYLTARLENL